jgi:hypothetical protein
MYKDKINIALETYPQSGIVLLSYRQVVCNEFGARVKQSSRDAPLNKSAFEVLYTQNTDIHYHGHAFGSE